MKLEKEKSYSFWEVIFFSNFFMGLMSLGLNLETNIKLDIPLNSVPYYLCVVSATILFYLFAYRIPKHLKTSTNPRTLFYITHRKFINWFTLILWLVCVISGLFVFITNFHLLFNFHWIHYFILGGTFILATSYYNWKFGFSLRRFTWLKPVLIAWTWAITTVYLPILLLNQLSYFNDPKFYFLFTQTFMYFIVNAIMFDMKDYEDDTNRGLKTFAVIYGIKFMLNRVIIPLIFIGFLSFILFGIYDQLPLHRVIFMLVPILLMAVFANQLNRPKSILFYLIAIDGMILVKAIFGILSVLLFE